MKLKKIISTVLLSLLSMSVYADVYFTAPTTFLENDRVEWSTLEAKMLTTPDPNIFIYWQGLGGGVSMMEQFVYAMSLDQMMGKSVTIVLTGDSYSCHAVAPCSATSILHNDTYFLMYHKFADQDGHPLVSPMYLNEFKEDLEPCLNKGILTTYDLHMLFKISEVYVYKINGQYVRSYKLDRRLFNDITPNRFIN